MFDKPLSDKINLG